MAEPKSIIERMRDLGWRFECDINDAGEIVSGAYKLLLVGVNQYRVTDYHTDQIFKDDVAVCMAAYDADLAKG
ncbi:MAG: hypothetical protein ACOVN0_01935 [Niveispirillum sp.]|uniref:hypothetical protein n=1 Tax=Niveispirillum sp. TaxID=1917217 RepID=UPI003BA7A641